MSEYLLRLKRLLTDLKRLLTADLSSTKKNKSRLTKFIDSKRKLTNKQRVYLFRQLSYLIESGYPIEQSLKKILPVKEKSKAWTYHITNMILTMRNTGSLIDCLRESNLFGNDILYQVRGGELSGQLPEVLMDISSDFEEQNKVSKNLKVMMIYPVILIMVLYAAIYIISTVVLPSLFDALSEFGGELSGLSKFVIGVSNVIVDYGLFIFLTPLLIVTLIIYLRRHEHFGRLYDTVLLNIPIVKSMVLMGDQIRYSRVFEALFRSGIALEECLDCAACSVKNSNLRSKAFKAKADVIKNGIDFSVALSNLGIYDSTESQLIYISTEVSTEKMCEVFKLITKRTTIELEAKSKSLMQILEPVIMIILAVVIGVFVIGLYSPVYSLLDSI